MAIVGNAKNAKVVVSVIHDEDEDMNFFSVWARGSAYNMYVSHDSWNVYLRRSPNVVLATQGENFAAGAQYLHFEIIDNRIRVWMAGGPSVAFESTAPQLRIEVFDSTYLVAGDWEITEGTLVSFENLDTIVAGNAKNARLTVNDVGGEFLVNIRGAKYQFFGEAGMMGEIGIVRLPSTLLATNDEPRMPNATYIIEAIDGTLKIYEESTAPYNLRAQATDSTYLVAGEWEIEVGTLVSFENLDTAPTGTNMQLNLGTDFKTVDSIQINIGSTWKDVAGVSIAIGGAWKTVF